VTDAPTTPIPRTSMKIRSAPNKRSSVGMIVGALVVVVIGVGGYLVLARKSSAPQAGPAVASPAAVAVETVRVAAQPAPPVAPSRRQTTPPPAPPAAAARQGYISVNSNPPGTLFIDGRDLGSVPVIEEAVSAGRHTIRVERAGYRTKTETIDVPANTTERRTYVLDQEGGGPE
jgi:hypothetical protein